LWLYFRYFYFTIFGLFWRNPMSYLDLPRIHFGGLFFTGPSTINNITPNYEASTKLEGPNNQYIPQVAGWNALGVAQWWLEECTVLSAVGPDGAAVTGGDPLIGGTVQSPSPSTPLQDASGAALGIAKMVDLDPDQQGRSALFGVNLFVTLPNGAGFWGALSVAELRQLNARITPPSPDDGGSWLAVGTWMGVLQNVTWTGDISSSPLLVALKAASGLGISVRFTADLHQNSPQNLLTPGDLFCYGRMMGSFGPTQANELAQVLPGRQLAVPVTPTASTENAAVQLRKTPAREAVVARAVAKSTEVAAPSPVLSPGFALLRTGQSGTLLHVDLGAAFQLALQNPSPMAANGTFLASSGFQVAIYSTSTSTYQPVAAGAIDFSQQYVNLPSQNKNCMLVKNAGMVTMPLTAAEATLAKTNPLALLWNGTPVLVESATGIWADVAVSSVRMEIGSAATTAQVQVQVLQFGAPFVSTGAPLTATVDALNWVAPYHLDDNPQTVASTDLKIAITSPNAAGIATVTLTLNTAGNTLPPPREPLNSLVYFVILSDLDGNPISDTSSDGASISVLLWSSYTPPAQPGWGDIAAVFGAYARLYPGMKSRLDISDQATVAGFLGDIYGHMSADINDPAYMPVTRDLQPAKVQMILSWLKQQMGSAS
jgi:hypothetical protein